MATATVNLERRTQGFFRTVWNRMTPTKSIFWVSRDIFFAARQKPVRIEVRQNILLEDGNIEDLFIGSQNLAANLFRAGVTEVVIPRGTKIDAIVGTFNALTDRGLSSAIKLFERSNGSIQIIGK